MNRWRAALARIDALTLKERALVLGACVLVVFALWQYLLMDPQALVQADLRSALERRRADIATLQEQAEAIVRRSQLDPDAPNRALRDRYRQRIEALDADIAASAANLIAPERVAEVLETVLRRSGGLAVLAVEGLGSEPLLETPAASGSAKPAAGGAPGRPAGGLAGAYKHGVRITFSGNFADTLAYLRDLEALPWSFFWEGIEFRVEDYPRAVASIVVYTLSLDRRWIGV
ncbi:MAG: hypothetical protein IT495_11135 [Gammaproteobacteria bacterium]|nr:hypothetical protein [Gammaproteobacteria bacterium]